MRWCFAVATLAWQRWAGLMCSWAAAALQLRCTIWLLFLCRGRVNEELEFWVERIIQWVSCDRMAVRTLAAQRSFLRSHVPEQDGWGRLHGQ